MRNFVFFLMITTAYAQLSDDKIIAPKNIGQGNSREGRSLYGKIALTFDDGPNANTPYVLDVLSAYSDALEREGKPRIKATFFINGDQVARYQKHMLQYQNSNGQTRIRPYAVGHLSDRSERLKIVERIVNEGHTLANHSVSHSQMNFRPLLRRQDLVANEIFMVHEVVESWMPDLKDCQQFWFFRAPYGAWSARNVGANVDEIVNQYIGPIFWDVGGDMTYDSRGIPIDGADWHKKCKSNILQCARGYLNRSYRQSRKILGGVVLMHDIHRTTAILLEAVLRVWTGLNPYDPATQAEAYRRVAKLDSSLVQRYQFGGDKAPVLEIVGLEQLEELHRPEFDSRFAVGGACASE